MTATTGTTPFSDWQALSPLLQALGCAPVDPATPTAWQNQGDQGNTLLIYGSPQQALANAMDQGEEPEKAMQQWLQTAQQMTEHFRRHRKTTILIAEDTLKREPEKSLNRIAEAWNLQRPPRLPTPGPAVDTEQEPLHQLLAAYMVASTPALSEAAQRLEACALPPATPAPDTRVDADAHYQHIAALKQQPGLDAAVARLESEKATLEGQLKALKANTQAQAKEIAQQQEHRNNLEEENQLLLEQLHIVQEELESRHHQHQQALTSQQQRHQQAQNQLQGEVENLRQNLAATDKAHRELKAEHHDSQRQSTLALATANAELASVKAELKRMSANKAWKATRKVTGYGRKSRLAKQRTLAQNRQTIEQSGMFDTQWYLETYPDVAQSGIDPIEHYLRMGATEGRNPGKVFDTLWYLMHYRDVAESGLNPLIHYIRFGRQEDRSPRPGAVVSLPAPQQPQPTQH